MKKKMMLFLCAACTAALVLGCGTGKKDDAGAKDKKEESGSKEQAETIEYNVDDYVELGEYKGLKFSVGNYEVTEEQVTEEITSILSAYPVYEDTEKETVEEGDFVNIDYQGMKGDEAFTGGTAEGAVLEIGSNSFIPGFEDGLIGAKVGEKVDLNLTFPEDYQNEELAGQAVVFHVTVNKIVNKSEMTIEALNDEFVEENLASQGYKTVEELKKGVRENLEASNKSIQEAEIQAGIFAELRKTCKINGFPEGLLEKEIEEYKERYEAGLKNSYGMSLSEYLEVSQMTEDDFNAQVEQERTESLENQLLLEAIAKKENIEIDDEKYGEYKKSIVTDYGYASEEALVEQYGEEYIRSVYLSEQVMEFLKENADITYSKAEEDAQTDQETSLTDEKQEEADEETGENPEDEAAEE
ncbi:MAG: trigger factor [Lachnospiraceae bacterium]|nr:trigger factor [Lachnospiraceae bacterium]